MRYSRITERQSLKTLKEVEGGRKVADMADVVDVVQTRGANKKRGRAD